jgi:phosphoribosylamine--glycine ligase
MDVLIIGSGGREHAMAWKLRQSPHVDLIFVAPGNAGTANLGVNIPLAATEIDALVSLASQRQVGLTMVGPEGPLALGLVDRFHEAGLPVVGPTQAAARIESSKLFAKRLMQQHGIPTAHADDFSDYAEARRYVEGASLPLVVKADGLAAGKGVTVCQERQEALAALQECMGARLFGDAGDHVLVEECLTGREVSVFAFTDGAHISPLVAACDYKRARDDDQGPNTGGMGAYSPPPFWTAELADRVMDTIMRPTVAALAGEGSPFTGVLYAGLMLTDDGPKVLEFNCRLGDPETQVVLPRLKTDLLEVLVGIAGGTLDGVSIGWSDEACVGVVATSGGYPGEYRTGYPIEGLGRLDPGAMVFHAGTRGSEGVGEDQVLPTTDGGRVLSVVARGATLEEARASVYTNLARIHFPGIHYRRDIARGVTAQTLGG